MIRSVIIPLYPWIISAENFGSRKIFLESRWVGQVFRGWLIGAWGNVWACWSFHLPPFISFETG